MSDIIFVSPTEKPLYSHESVGTLILASILKNKGLDVDIYRFLETEYTDYHSFVEKTAENIVARNPKIVSFYCRCDYYLIIIRIAEKIKSLNKDIIIIFGGPQADALAEETLECIPYIDYCCLGEGETTVYPLFSALLNGEDPTNTAGLVYRDDKMNIIKNPRPEMMQNLDESPKVDLSLLPEAIMKTLPQQTIHVDTGRGCPFKCTFCSTSLFWKRKFRLKSNERVIEEIKELYENHDCRNFNFIHDLFTANKKKLIDFCEDVQKCNLKINWSCSSRVDTLDEETIIAMKNAGLASVFLGVESGSVRMQKLIKKNIDPEQALNIVKILTKHGIHPTASFIYGIPEETDDDVSATMSLTYRMKDCSPNITVQYHLCAMFYGSELFENYKDDLTFSSQVPVEAMGVSALGIAENSDFIIKNKQIFPHYYEYKTSFRSGLNNLGTFMNLSLKCYPLFKHIIDQYPENKLIDMYYDFNNINGEFLENFAKKKVNMSDLIDAIDKYIHAKFDPDAQSHIFDFINFEKNRIEFIKSGIPENIVKFDWDISSYLKCRDLNKFEDKGSIVLFKNVNGNCKISVINK